MSQTIVESMFLTALWVNLKGIITVRRSETKLLMQVISFDHNCINYYIIFIFFMPSFWQTSIHFMHFDKSNEMDSIIRCKYKWVFSVLRLQFLPKFWTFSKHYQLQVVTQKSEKRFCLHLWTMIFPLITTICCSQVMILTQKPSKLHYLHWSYSMIFWKYSSG